MCKAAYNRNLHVLQGGNLCSCIDLFQSLSYVHTQEECDKGPDVMKDRKDACDVVEYQKLSICTFCSYAIADNGLVREDKTHKHEHFRGPGGKIVGAHTNTYVWERAWAPGN
jgi:uncharacterized protein YuzB (UPF0349 family)